MTAAPTPSPSHQNGSHETPSYETPTYDAAPYGAGSPAAPGPYAAPPAYAAPVWPGAEWQGARDAALVLAILAVCTGWLGVILGPIALSQANKARRLGPDAGAARVTAWVGIGLSALALLFLIAYFAFFGIMFAEMFRQIEQEVGNAATAAVALSGL